MMTARPLLTFMILSPNITKEKHVSRTLVLYSNGSSIDSDSLMKIPLSKMFKTGNLAIF